MTSTLGLTRSATNSGIRSVRGAYWSPIDGEVLAFEEANPPKFIEHCDTKAAGRADRRTRRQGDRFAQFLRPCCERPRSSRAAEKCNKFPPPHARRPRVEPTLAHGWARKVRHSQISRRCLSWLRHSIIPRCVTQGGKTITFDSFEYATHAMAPRVIYYCAQCAKRSGVKGDNDRAA